MFDKEILAIKNEILALKQQKLKSISKLQTVEDRVPLDFVLHEVGGDSLGSQTIWVDIWAKTDVKPLISYCLDLDSVIRNRLFVCTKYADFDAPPDFRFHLQFTLVMQGHKSDGDYSGIHIPVDFLITSTSNLNITVTEA